MVSQTNKKPTSAPVILGGAGYSIFPESALEHSSADMGIWGEGEEAFPLLLEKLDAGRHVAGVPGLYVKGKGLRGSAYSSKTSTGFPFPMPACLPLAEGSAAPFPSRPVAVAPWHVPTVPRNR